MRRTCGRPSAATLFWSVGSAVLLGAAAAAEPPDTASPVIELPPLVAPTGLEYADDARPERELPLPELEEEDHDTDLTLESQSEMSNHPSVVSLPWWEPPAIEEPGRPAPVETGVDSVPPAEELELGEPR